MSRHRAAAPRIGIGYDSHAFARGRALVLAGVKFESDVGLTGHSDADVVAHAVTDAVLGAAGMGDIGAHFPDTDARWRGADSIELLAQVVQEIGKERALVVGNVDVTLVLERPKIGHARDRMSARLAVALGTRPDSVNVKVTTNEGMGFVGRGEGAAAMAVALLVPGLADGES